MSEKEVTVLPKTPRTPEEQLVWEAKAKIRLLLNLWDLGEGKAKIKKGDLTKRIVRTGEVSKDYEAVLTGLREGGAIAFSMDKRVMVVEITDVGQQVLADGLKNRDSQFEFDGSQIGTRLGNALLRWLRLQDAPVKPKPEVEIIASYERFKVVALKVYDRLNRDYNFDNLVPIYRMRRAIAERVSRSQFNEWMLEMQADRLLILQGGEMTEITSDKAEDSIKTSLGELRYYATRLTPQS
ncbi:hypothetical protein BCD67_19390 [Oscillatoriales cyanobacterium USR001]|nr:hypothetical protein BCD67_19390 [Oscillatoriales cyanobacterium USR001]